MHYQCKFCGSHKKPKIVNHFPPKLAKCLECYKTAPEKDFLKEDESFTMPIHYYH